MKSFVATLKWPKARQSHASTVINTISSNQQTISHLMVLGGLEDSSQTLKDCWIMNLSSFIWYQVMYISMTHVIYISISFVITEININIDNTGV